MADGSQDVGFGSSLVFAGDTIRITATVTTGGTASGVTVAEFNLYPLNPIEVTEAQTAIAAKSIGDGVTVTDGTVDGTVDVAVVLQPADTTGLYGDYYHELKLTVSSDEVHVNKGRLRLHKSES